jgi:RecB family endonuclease NucS
MLDEANWVSLAGTFALETALSDYIAIHPQRLEAGMIAHPVLQARELTFSDARRADVILQDRHGRAVITECKQGAPSLDALAQVSHYRRCFAEAYPELGNPRAIVVHGGSSRVTPEVASQADRLSIELVYFELQVNFFGSRN